MSKKPTVKPAKKPSAKSNKKPHKVKSPMTYRTLIISDFHAPVNHPDAIEFLKALKKKYKFDQVVCVGDEADYGASSYHEKSSELPSAGEELRLARIELAKLFKAFPNVVSVDSNHTSMAFRKAQTAGLPKDVIKSYRDQLQAPKGWVWKFDHTIQTPMGPVYICHGKSGSPGRLAAQYGMSCIQGHFHSTAQITYQSTPERLIFDAHTGCLVDDTSLALSYNKIQPKRPVISVIILIDGVPQIVPMKMANGRWTGKL